MEQILIESTLSNAGYRVKTYTAHSITVWSRELIAAMEKKTSPLIEEKPPWVFAYIIDDLLEGVGIDHTVRVNLYLAFYPDTMHGTFIERIDTDTSQ